MITVQDPATQNCIVNYSAVLHVLLPNMQPSTIVSTNPQIVTKSCFALSDMLLTLPTKHMSSYRWLILLAATPLLPRINSRIKVSSELVPPKPIIKYHRQLAFIFLH